jgi:T5SS/PEP-CTERM-associated repeat protein
MNIARRFFLRILGGTQLMVVAICTLCSMALPHAAKAAVTPGGNVTPMPPAGGGNVPGIFFVGDTTVGTLAIGGGTPLNVTGNSTIVGDDATGLGIVTLTGLGSDLSTANDLVIGNLGAGSVGVANIAKVTMADDLLMGVGAGSSGELNVSNFGSIVDVFDSVSAGVSGTAIILVTAGGRVFADDTVIGSLATGNGRVTVTGASSLWQQPNSMTVGDAGLGRLEIFDQAHMQTTNAIVGNAATGVGIVEVSDPSSSWDITGLMTVGVNGEGYVRVFDGGRITTTSNVRVATVAAGEGHIEVNGLDARLAVGTTINVGEFGFGTLRVLNGGRVTSTNATLADNLNSRGEAVVDGTGSTWEITGTLDVSDPGEATLTIAHGGFVKSTSTTTIRTAGTMILNDGRLEAGGISGLQNQGLTVGGGTIVAPVTNPLSGEIRVNTGDKLVITGTLATAGLVDVDGGELEVLSVTTNTGDIDIRDGTLRFQGGLSNLGASQLAIVGGEVDVFGTITNGVGGQVVVGGESHAAFHDTFTNNGMLLITPGSELLTLENLSFAAGAAFSVQLASDDPADGYGRAHSDGSATLAGALSVALAGGFSPTAGDTFTVLTSLAGVSGTFGSQTLPALAAGLNWDVDYLANSVVLRVIGREGDYNQNGIVDGADYVVYRNTLGQSGAGLAADGNLNNQIDIGDYNVWRAHFGQAAVTGSSVGATTAVPEGGTIALLAIAVVLVGGQRSQGKIFSQRRDGRRLGAENSESNLPEVLPRRMGSWEISSA